MRSKPLPGMVVFAVGLEVLAEVFDATGQQGHLHLGRSRVTGREPVFIDDVFLCLGGEHDCRPPLV